MIILLYFYNYSEKNLFIKNKVINTKYQYFYNKFVLILQIIKKYIYY